jgi:hypothetical protein
LSTVPVPVGLWMSTGYGAARDCVVELARRQHVVGR